MIGHPPEHVEALPVIAEWSVVVQVGTRRASRGAVQGFTARTCAPGSCGAGRWDPHEKLRGFVA